MSTRTVARLAPLSGALFAVLLVAGAITMGNFDYLPSGSSLVTFYMAHVSQVTIGSYLGLLGGIFLVVFTGVVVHRMRRELPNSVLPDIALAGGAAAGTLAVAAYAVLVVGAGRAETADGISTATAIAVYDVYGSIVGSAMPFMLAAFVGAAGLASLAGSTLPRWLGIVSLVLAVALASPISYIAVAVVMVWAPVVGLLLVASPRPTAAFSMEPAA